VMTPVGALQATLAGEHAAVYLYGVLGGQVSRSSQPKLATLVGELYDAHVSRRNRLTELVSAHDVDPVASASAYRLPNALTNATELKAAAREIETRCLQLYGQTVGSTSGADRAWAITTLLTASTQVLALGIAPSDYPGMTV